MDDALEKIERFSDKMGRILVRGFHLLALFAIGGAIVWSAAASFFGMAAKGHASIEDILLLFIYLELGAMVGIYFKTSRMPVRFLIYVAITALTRMMIDVINVSHTADVTILFISGGILLLAFSELVLRYGSAKMPIQTGLAEMSDFSRKPRAKSAKSK